MTEFHRVVDKEQEEAWLKSGGQYCEKCKRCIRPLRARKNFCPEYWTICELCQKDIFRMTFVPREDAVITDFRVAYQDIPDLIKALCKAYDEKFAVIY